MSTSVLCNAYPNKRITVNANCWIICDEDETVAPIDINVNPVNNLPMMHCYKLSEAINLATSFATSVSTTHRENFNLSEPQKELICWHCKLGHANFKTGGGPGGSLLTEVCLCTHGR